MKLCCICSNYNSYSTFYSPLENYNVFSVRLFGLKAFSKTHHIIFHGYTCSFRPWDNYYSIYSKFLFVNRTSILLKRPACRVN